MFEKPITDMTPDEIEKFVEEMLDEQSKLELLIELLKAGFKIEELHQNIIIGALEEIYQNISKGGNGMLESMFKKARKKTITEAIEMTEEILKKFAGKKIKGEQKTECEIFENGFIVRTMEGTMRGKIGDYLMKGVNGELYVCDREVFEKTYEFIE